MKQGNTWAKIDLSDGDWEYQEDIDDDETYENGLLIIDDHGVIIDYDGCYELPKEVLDLIEDNFIAHELSE